VDGWLETIYSQLNKLYRFSVRETGPVTEQSAQGFSIWARGISLSPGVRLRVQCLSIAKDAEVFGCAPGERKTCIASRVLCKCRICPRVAGERNPFYCALTFWYKRSRIGVGEPSQGNHEESQHKQGTQDSKESFNVQKKALKQVDLAVVREQITNLVGNRAVEMVETTMERSR
jgi:hypothetical protein